MVTIDKKIVAVKLLENKPAETVESKQSLNEIVPLKRSDIIHGYTIKLKYADVSYYITLNFNENSELVEIFINSSSTAPQTNVLVQTLARMISNQLKYRVPLEKVIKHLDGMDSGEVYLVKFPGYEKGKFVKSLPDLIAKVLSLYSNEKELKKKLKVFDNITTKTGELKSHSQQDLTQQKEGNLFYCKECNQFTMKYEEGCFTCLSCGYSKCG